MLRKREVGETDRFYTFFTREQGKVTAIAKGVRKAEAKLASSLETATLSEIMVARTRGTGKITGAVLEESYPALHRSYVAIQAMTKFLLDVDRLVEAEERDEAVYELLAQFLKEAEQLSGTPEGESMIHLLTESAYYQLFTLLGYRLELNRCVKSHERLQSGERFFLSFEAGGVVREAHAREASDAQPISENAIKTLRLMTSEALHNIQKIRMDEKTLDEISRFRTYYRRWIRE